MSFDRRSVEQGVLSYRQQRNANGQQYGNRHQHQRRPAKEIHHRPGQQRRRRRRAKHKKLVYGLRPEPPLQQKAKNANKGKLSKISFEEYAKSVEPYTLEYTAELSGVSKEKLERLAKLYADPNRKVTSFWTMGFNQHTRGVWANNPTMIGIVAPSMIA